MEKKVVRREKMGRKRAGERCGERYREKKVGKRKEEMG